MKIQHLVILVKYAQGHVLFDAFLRHLIFLKPEKRRLFIEEIAALIMQFGPERKVVAEFIGQHNLSLKEGNETDLVGNSLNDIDWSRFSFINDEHVQMIFKSLLELFSSLYLLKYKQHKNDQSKFWYWNYSLPSTILKLMKLDIDQEINVHDVSID